jgi:hypothetical protein
MDDVANVDSFGTKQFNVKCCSVSSPPERGGGEPEPEHALTKDGIRCVKKVKIYIIKTENVPENFLKMTDDL